MALVVDTLGVLEGNANCVDADDGDIAAADME